MGQHYSYPPVGELTIDEVNAAILAAQGKIYHARITGGSGSSVTVTEFRNAIGATCTVTKTDNIFTLTFDSSVLADASKCSIRVTSAFVPDEEIYGIASGGRVSSTVVKAQTLKAMFQSAPDSDPLGSFEILITIFN